MDRCGSGVAGTAAFTVPAWAVPDVTTDDDVRTPPWAQLRVARPDDVDAVAALVESAYRGESSRAGWTTEADLLAGRRTDATAVAEVVAVATAVILLAEDAAGLLGCCALEDRGEHWYFGMFAVRPTAQSRGGGSALLAEAERRATSAGARALRLEVVHARLDLIAWYERRGYVRTGETRPFPYGDERFGLPRRDDLHFVVLAKPLPA